MNAYAAVVKGAVKTDNILGWGTRGRRTGLEFVTVRSNTYISLILWILSRFEVIPWRSEHALAIASHFHVRQYYHSELEGVAFRERGGAPRRESVLKFSPSLPNMG